MSDTIRTTAEIRSLNKKKILQYVTAHPEQTRKQIADGLELSFATVSNLVAQLSEEYAKLLAEKQEEYELYKKYRQDMISYRTAKQNVDKILSLGTEKQEQQKEQEQKR